MSVRPLHYSIGGKSGAWHTYASVSTAKRSTLGLMLLAFRDGMKELEIIEGERQKKGAPEGTKEKFTSFKQHLQFPPVGFGTKFEDGTRIEVGKGLLEGKRGWFMRCDLPWGPIEDKDTHEVKDAVSEGVLFFHRMGSAEDDTSPSSQDAPAAVDWDDESINAVLAVIAGHTEQDAQIAVAKSKLSRDLKNSALSGEAFVYLKAQGLIEVGDDGMIIRKAQ